MAKRFVVPFASTGDKTVTPDATDPSGAISYSQGWGAQYQLVDTDPSYRPVGRQEMNGVLYDITGAVAELQAQGVPSWVAPGGLVPPYVINALVRHTDTIWRSLIANNSATPVEGASWTEALKERQQPYITVLTGSGNFISPVAGRIKFRLWAGGGGGGGVGSSGNGGAGGGGSGGYSEGVISVAVGQSIAYVCGAAGTGGGVGGGGLTGGSSSFGTFGAADGGAGGSPNAVGGGNGGAGGISSLGTFNASGGPGSTGAPGSGPGGAGASSPGGGGSGGGGAVGTAGAGTTPAGGGGGRGGSGAGTGASGGAGLIIVEYLNV